MAAGLLALLCTLVCFEVLYAVKTPIPRSIVDDLTSALIGELQQANISEHKPGCQITCKIGNKCLCAQSEALRSVFIAFSIIS